jgi:DNA repair ATPase RecN
MNKERLEWVMSGLNQYALTTAEDHFLRATAEDFDKNQALTEKQEERLETLYREKSKLIPNKKPDPSSFKKGSSRKVKPRRPTGKYY